MSEPRVTIITPTFNHAAYIEACVQSVLAQTVADWEMIVVDDGSTDGTPELVSAFDDPRIRLERLPHRGQGALGDTYNVALRSARGRYLAILEGDDYWPSRKLERQLPVFDDGDVVICWGASLYVSADGTPLRRVGKIRAPRGGSVHIPLDRLFGRLVLENVIAPAVTVMARTDVLRSLGGFRQAGARHVVDSPTWLALSATAASSACYLNEVLGCYRVHAAQTSALKMPQMAADRRTIVMAAVAELDAEARARVGWTDESRRDLEARTALLSGMADLRLRRFQPARRHFTTALRLSRRPGDSLRAGLGALSAALRLDAFSGARWLRDQAARLLLRDAGATALQPPSRTPVGR